MITITSIAQKELVTLAQDEKEENQELRLSVVEGGCAGLTYKMEFDAPQKTDTSLEVEGLKVFIEEQSIPYLQGVTIDFESGLEGGFKISNPNAKKTCGCGESFTAE